MTEENERVERAIELACRFGGTDENGYTQPQLALILAN